MEEDKKNPIEGEKWRYGRFLGHGNKTSYIIQRQFKRGVKITSNPFPEIGFVKHSCENMGSFELKSSAASAASRDGNLNSYRKSMSFQSQTLRFPSDSKRQKERRWANYAAN